MDKEHQSESGHTWQSLRGNNEEFTVLKVMQRLTKPVQLAWHTRERKIRFAVVNNFLSVITRTTKKINLEGYTTFAHHYPSTRGLKYTEPTQSRDKP